MRVGNVKRRTLDRMGAWSVVLLVLVLQSVCVRRLGCVAIVLVCEAIQQEEDLESSCRQVPTEDECLDASLDGGQNSGTECVQEANHCSTISQYDVDKQVN